MPGKKYYLADTCATCKFCRSILEPYYGRNYYCRYGQAEFDPPDKPGEVLDPSIATGLAQRYEQALLAWIGKTEVDSHGTCELYQPQELSR